MMAKSGGNSKTRRKKHILVVSGDPRALAEAKKELMHSYDVGIAAEGAAVAALEAYGADAVIICADGQSGGLTAFTALFAEAERRGIPVLVLAQSDDESAEASAFALGAVDYCIKRSAGSGALVKRLSLRILASEAVREVPAPVPPEELLRGKTILIAEDVEINRDILAAMLSGVEDLTLDFAEDGMEALEKFEQHQDRYAIVFLDVHMPRMDGIQAAKAIRSLDSEAARNTPVFALSANGSESDSARLCEEAGMNGFLQKPVDYEEFIDICSEYING